MNSLPLDNSKLFEIQNLSKSQNSDESGFGWSRQYFHVAHIFFDSLVIMTDKLEKWQVYVASRASQ